MSYCGSRPIAFVPAFGSPILLRVLAAMKFTVILHDLRDNEHAGIVAGKILSELAAVFQIAKEMIHISASIGIATSTEGGTPEDLIKRAEMAMYAAKSAGRNRFSFLSPDQEETVGRAS